MSGISAEFLVSKIINSPLLNMKPSSQLNKIIKQFESLADEKAVEGMARYAITAQKIYGVSIPTLRMMAKKIGTNHSLALELWSTGIQEARILASLIDDPSSVTEKQMSVWAEEFENWAVCDACCGNLFDRTPFGWNVAVKWCRREEEFVKRAGFVLIAELAVHDKQAGDRRFVRYLGIIKRGSVDERNFVKKAVSWALRQIGKRNLSLNAKAIQTATTIAKIDSAAARWVAADALHELISETVQQRLKKKELRSNPIR